MAPIRFDRGVCADIDEAVQREWLETNGLGGFACSTICGANTRRYHGLLTAATEPLIRFLLLSKLEEVIVAGGERLELSTNFYPGVAHPQGYRYLTGVRLDPFPVFTFEAGGITVEKRVFMPDGENTVVIEYAVAEGQDCALEVRPLIAFRGYHELTHRNSALNGEIEIEQGIFSIQPYELLPRLYFAHDANRVEATGQWFFDFQYPAEKKRGLDFTEDLYCPCTLFFDLKANRPARVIASTIRHSASDTAALALAEIERRRAFKTEIETAASQFVIRRGQNRSIIAGYPWFTDWGRDTMIALPGVALATGRFDVAREILLGFTTHIRDGLLPNHFPDSGGPPVYNSADASLWLFDAVRQYVRTSGDLEFVRQHLYERLGEIVEAYSRGVPGPIRMDRDGLIVVGNEDTQLTWMDARVNGKPVTPRHGKPVEIQGLWYSAVRLLAMLAWEFSDPHGRVYYESIAIKTGESLNEQFWNPETGCLFDVVRSDTDRDASIRPNQLVALSSGYCAIPLERARSILAVVEQKLLTAYGLRTLAPDHPAYRGRCDGPPSERDAAYHQGTVWPWLLGPFITASWRFDSEGTRLRLPSLLAGLRRYAREYGCGQIPEIFNGDAPHEPGGCFAQAWSVAELLRTGL